MNEVIYVLLYLVTAVMGFFGFIIVPILATWVGLWFAEFCCKVVPIVGHILAKIPHALRKLLESIVAWPFKKLWGLTVKYGPKFVQAAWRGFVITVSRKKALPAPARRRPFISGSTTAPP